MIDNVRAKIDGNDNNNESNNFKNHIISKPQVIDPTINLINDVNILCDDSGQVAVEDDNNDNNNGDDVVYFPVSASRNSPSHIFNNIVQPSKPLRFIPIDVILSNFILLDESDIIFEKYIYNIEVQNIHKLYYSVSNPEGESSPMILASAFNPAMVKLEFSRFLQRLRSLQFTVHHFIPTSPLNSKIEILMREQFFDPNNFEVFVMMTRLKINNDTFMEIYDLENLIKVINAMDNDFIATWDKLFLQYRWELVKYQNKILWIKDLDNGIEFNYVKVIKRGGNIYIDNIILELKLLHKHGITQSAIRDFNYLKFNIGSLMEKVDTSLIKINEVEDDSHSRNASPALSPSLSSSESLHEFEVQPVPVSVPVSEVCDTSNMARNFVNRTIQLNTSRRNSINNIDHNSMNNTPVSNSLFRLSTALTPFSFISNSYTEDITDLVKEITWLEVCNTIIAIALILIVVSLAFLFFDPHFIKSKIWSEKLFFFLRSALLELKTCFDLFLIEIILIFLVIHQQML
jgi:hypothetical protein